MRKFLAAVAVITAMALVPTLAFGGHAGTTNQPSQHCDGTTPGTVETTPTSNTSTPGVCTGINGLKGALWCDVSGTSTSCVADGDAANSSLNANLDGYIGIHGTHFVASCGNNYNPDGGAGEGTPTAPTAHDDGVEPTEIGTC